MNRVHRYDQGTLRKPHRTEEGFLYFECVATRAGVFEYRRADGSIRREWRPREEVARADSLATLGRKPVTLTHPEEGGVPVLVTPGNAKQFAAGAVGEEVEVIDRADDLTEEEGPYVRVTGSVYRSDAIDAIESGMRAVSCGYECDLEEKAGTTPTGERYDCIQRNITYNHLAIVPRGRAGDVAVLRADTDDAVQWGGITPQHSQKVTHMKRKNLRGDEYEIPADQSALAELLLSDVRTLKADMEEMKEDIDGMEEELKKEDADPYADRIDAMQEKMDAQGEMLDKIVKMLASMGGEELEEAGEMEREDRADAFKNMDDGALKAHLEKVRADAKAEALARLELEGKATALKIDGIDKLDDRKLLEAVAAKATGTEVRADASDDYLRGMIANVRIDDGASQEGASYLGTGNRQVNTDGALSGKDLMLANLAKARQARLDAQQ